METPVTENVTLSAHKIKALPSRRSMSRHKIRAFV